MSSDYSTRTVAMLRELCKARNISPLPKRKNDLLSVLKKWDDEHEDEEIKNSLFKEPNPPKVNKKRKQMDSDNEAEDNEKKTKSDDDDDSDFREPAAKRRKINNNNNNKNNKSKSKSKSKSPKSKTKSKSQSSSSKTTKTKDEEEEEEAEEEDDDIKEPESSSNTKTKTKTKTNSSNSNDTLKIVCFNINGVRAAAKHGLEKFLKSQNADIVCFSEMKADLNQNPIKFNNSYKVIWNECTEKKGYAGTCIISKLEPISITKGIGCEDGQGRAIIIEFNKFYLVNTYVPNSGQKLKFEERRKSWDTQMKKFLQKLQSKKSVIWTGDLNVAIEDDDVYDGKTNKNRCKTAGFTPYERKNFRSMLTDLDMVDSWRSLNPNAKSGDGYTFFTARARGKDMKKENLGWRLDYFIVSKNIMPLIENITIERDIECSDHVPLVLTLKNPNNNL